MPAILQAIGAWSRPTAFLERNRARYGRRFTIRVVGQPPFVVLSDPEDIKEVFLAPPEVLHPGEGARILEPLVGRNSVILLDEGPHLEQRRLLLPAFHGESIERLSATMRELAEREIEGWPRGEVFALHAPLQRLTLEIILRSVFGLERGAQLERLRELLGEILSFSEHPASLIQIAQRPIFGRGPWVRLQKLLVEADELVFALIDERRHAEEAAGSSGSEDAHGRSADVLGLLLGARHEDDSPMSAAELRDELMTALVAGHETTASQLAWTFERLAREPRVLRSLAEELDEGSSEEYLTACIQEVLRLRPVLPNAEPRLVKREVEIGDVRYPPGVVLIANAYLLHHDPEIYPEPYAFRPERFLDSPPGTYTWIPFGGGRRRCLGASFAMQEMKIVLRALLETCELHPAPGGPERTRRRSITISPVRGGQVILRDRRPARSRPSLSASPAAA
jgi:hypothetical protein